jgi:hypothetical protein
VGRSGIGDRCEQRGQAQPLGLGPRLKRRAQPKANLFTAPRSSLGTNRRLLEPLAPPPPSVRDRRGKIRGPL